MLPIHEDNYYLVFLVTDQSDEQETKVRRIIEMLETKVDAVWKNSSKTEQDLHNSLIDLKFLFDKLSIYSEGMHQDAYLSLMTYLALPAGIRPSSFKGNDHLANLVDAAITQLIANAKSLLPAVVDNACIEMVDLTGQGPPPAVDPLAEIFSETAKVLDKHPEVHHFSKTTTYNPANSSCFVKTVREEFIGLQKICSTETKSEMGILSRTFEDRMDLLSFLIRGPEGTPYQDAVFIFGAALPDNYPNAPPKFHFHAFNAGRLNPNLYAEGKVCVSLLGTWSGQDEREIWTKDSNIVQILISIQGNKSHNF